MRLLYSEVEEMADVRNGPFVVEIPMRNLWPAKETQHGGREGCGGIPGTGVESNRSGEESGPAERADEAGATKNSERDVASGRMCMASRSNGTPCAMRAARGKSMCARHERWYRSIPVMMGMPYPEDAVGLQDVMAQVVAMVLNRELDAERAKVVAQICQVMQKNLKDYRREVAQAEMDEQRWTRVQ